jgi:hypothetical protein
VWSMNSCCYTIRTTRSVPSILHRESETYMDSVLYIMRMKPAVVVVVNRSDSQRVRAVAVVRGYRAPGAAVYRVECASQACEAIRPCVLSLAGTLPCSWR